MGFFSKLFKSKPADNGQEKYLKEEYKKEKRESEQTLVEYVDFNETKAKKSETVKKTSVKPKAVKQETPPEIKAVKETNTKIGGTKGFFEIKKTKDGRYVFNLYASNRIIVATSQTYSSSQSALNGIKSVIANAKSAGVEDSTVKNPEKLPYPKWEIYKDKGDGYRFRLCASNGSCVCHSQGYTTKSACKNGIASIIKHAESAEIGKAYLEKA